jgi:predicted nucleic acid-binding protein
MDKLRSRDYSLCVTTEILLEYEEKLIEKFSNAAAAPFMEALSDRSNVEWTNVFFRWNLIYPDLDDNKFVDCAIASRAD